MFRRAFASSDDKTFRTASSSGRINCDTFVITGARSYCVACQKDCRIRLPLAGIPDPAGRRTLAQCISQRAIFQPARRSCLAKWLNRRGRSRRLGRLRRTRGVISNLSDTSDVAFTWPDDSVL